MQKTGEWTGISEDLRPCSYVITSYSIHYTKLYDGDPEHGGRGPRLVVGLQREPVRGEGLELTAIKVIDASRTTRALNAYITGVGPSRELVLFDTLLEAMTPAEVAAVVAHELGHHRRRDVLLRYGITVV